MQGRVAEPLVLLCSRCAKQRMPKAEEGFQKQRALCVPAADGATVSRAEHGEKPLLAQLTSIPLDTESLSHVHYMNTFPANPACQGNGEYGTHRGGFLRSDHLVNSLCIWDFPFKVSWTALGKVPLYPTRYLLQKQRNEFSSGAVLI